MKPDPCQLPCFRLNFPPIPIPSEGRVQIQGSCLKAWRTMGTIKEVKQSHRRNKSVLRMDTPYPRKLLFGRILQRMFTFMLPSFPKTKRRNSGLKAVFLIYRCWQTNKGPYGSLLWVLRDKPLYASPRRGSSTWPQNFFFSWSILWILVFCETHLGNYGFRYSVWNNFLIDYCWIRELVAKKH